MSAIYKSIVYDLTSFGIFTIKRALFSADMDEGVLPSVSFDGGRTFKSVKLNQEFRMDSSTGKVQVKMLFPNNNSSEYTIKTVGYLPNYILGTVIYFKKKSNGKFYKTTIGENGKYIISLPRGEYDIFVESKTSTPIITNYLPSVQTTQNLDYKINSVESILKSVPWARYSIYDIFDDENKISPESTTIIDPYGNLSDGNTSTKVKYWALCFDI
jgi:hypothetical protein